MKIVNKIHKIINFAIPLTGISVAPVLIGTSNTLSESNIIKNTTSVNAVDTVFTRFINDVKNNHTALLNNYVNDYKNMNKDSKVYLMSSRRVHNSEFMHWDEKHEWDHVRFNEDLNFIDNVGSSFYNNKPRLVCNQTADTSALHYVPKTSWSAMAINLDTTTGTGFGQPWNRMNDWVYDKGERGDWQNYLNELLTVTKANKNTNFDTVNIKLNQPGDSPSGYRVHYGNGERRNPGWYNEFHNGINHYGMLSTIFEKHFHNGETWLPSSGWGTAWWYLKLNTSTPFDITYWTYSLNNLFQIKDFGYDSTDGYYYTLGINDLYLSAVEGEKLNTQVPVWWQNELDGKNRPNWIPDFSKTQPAFEKIRDEFFQEVEKLISDRVITYDNYEIVRKYVHDISAQSRQCPSEGWLTNEIKSNVDLHNSGWTDISESYKIVNCPDLWDKLVTILPELHYTIHYDRNSNPDNVDGGEWEDLQQHEPSYDWNTLANRVKVPLGYDGKNSVAFKAEVDVITEQNNQSPVNADTWRSNFDSSGQPIDTNITNNLLPIDFLFDKTVQLEIDPKNEHPDHKDTYWHFDKNMKKLCNIQNEPDKYLILRNDCSQYLPSTMWSSLSGSSSEKLQQILKDDDGNPASVFGYKDIHCDFDYNVKDEYLKVIPDDKKGQLIIRLINPIDQSIVSSVELNGFLKDEGHSDIVLPFGKIFCTMTGTSTDNIQVEVLNPKKDTVLEYAVEDPNVATVSKTDETGRVIKISGLTYGITKVNVQLKDSGGMVISTTDFWIYVDIKPEAMEIVEPFESATIKAGSTGVAEEGQNFKVNVWSDKEKTKQDCLQAATYRLINAPEWVGISNSDIWEDPKTHEIEYIDSGYIYVIDAQEGTYVFTVEATNWVDQTMKVTSKQITLVVQGEHPTPDPEHSGLSGGAIAAIVCSSVAGAGMIGGFSAYAVKRRKK